MATISAKAGHQNGTKLVTPGIRRRSLAGNGSSGGLSATAIALRNSSRTTMNMTKKQSQIESSPNPRQNLLGLGTKSSDLIPLLVLIIRITPIALVASNLSRTPADSA